MKHFFFLSMLMISLGAYSTNISVSGNISTNTTWSADTVFVTGNVTVDSTIVLTINPGVIVLFQGNYSIISRGTIVAVANPTAPIEFTTDSTGFSSLSHTGWAGIIFDNEAYPIGGDTSRFINCAFSYGYASTGVVSVLHFSKIVIDQCLFHHNYSDDDGGAINISDSANIIISRCHFENNFAENGGGAINVNCEGTGDYSRPIIDACHFSNNICLTSNSYYGGGAVKLSGYTQAILSNCKIVNNACINGSGGGGVLVSGHASPTLVNNIISGNHAQYNGGGVMIRYYTNPVLVNNTIVFNSTDSMGGGIGVGCSTDSLKMINNIVYGNTSLHGSQIIINNDDSCKSFVFVNNLIQGGTAFELGDTALFIPLMLGNLDADPMISDLVDFTVMPCSPVIDAGFSSIPLPTTDIYHNPRIFGAGIDLGAVERQIPVDITVNDTLKFCLGDSIQYQSVWYTANGLVNDTLAGVLYCDSVFSMHIIAVDCSSIEENSTVITVYPNPSNGEMYFVSNNISGSERIDFYDVTSRMLYSVNLTSEKQYIQLPAEIKGIVFYNIINNSGLVSTGKLLVE